jgi:hypothetical protein
MGAPFEIHHALSDNRRKRLNIDSARRALGYSPRDDSYRIAGWNIPGMAKAAAVSLRRKMRILRRRSATQESLPNATG